MGKRDERGIFDGYVAQMTAAETAGQRKAVVADMCRMFAFKTAKAYKALKDNGWNSARAPRQDAGISRVNEPYLNMAAALIKKSVRKNGKPTMSVGDARSIMIKNGFDIPVSASRLRQLLNERGLNVKNTKAPAPHQDMRSEYPNHVHFADPSVCLIYFAPGGKQKIIGDDELYKNKNFLEGKNKCWRYVLTDHYSSSICVRYYAAMGETAVNMYDFLLYAWGQKKISSYIFHGVPELLIWDCGTANKARATTNALKAFGVKTVPHIPGNPRAKGQVENANNLVELHFESRLRFESVNSIEELNDAVERWCAAYNSNSLDELDTRLTRSGRVIGARSMLWNRITKEQLRELPDTEICHQIFTTGEEVRKVRGNLTVQFSHPKIRRVMTYSVADLDGVMIGMEVRVQPVLVKEGALIIASYKLGKKEISVELEPLEIDDVGFNVDAPVFGKDYKRPADTPREKNNKMLDETAADMMAGNLKTHSFIQPVSPFLRQTKGTPIEVAETVHTHEILISATEMAKRIRPELGYVPDGFIDRLKAEFPEGVPSNLLNDFVQEYQETESQIQATVYKFA